MQNPNSNPLQERPIRIVMTQTAHTLSLDLVGALAATVTRAKTLEELVRPLLELLQAVTGLESTYLTTIDENAGLQHILFARNTQRMQIPEGLSVPWEGTLCKRALDEGKFYSDDVANCWGDCEAARALGIITYASTPVRSEGGALYGTLCAASGESRPLTDGTEGVLRLFAQLIGQQVEREHLVDSLNKANSSLAVSAFTDSTTRLPNRRALMEDMHNRLMSYQSDEYALIVAFIDLDKFKAINDRYGHEVGDRFLEAVGGRRIRRGRNGKARKRRSHGTSLECKTAARYPGTVCIGQSEHRLRRPQHRCRGRRARLQGRTSAADGGRRSHVQRQACAQGKRESGRA
jgi:diguanylate cyclase